MAVGAAVRVAALVAVGGAVVGSTVAGLWVGAAVDSTSANSTVAAARSATTAVGSTSPPGATITNTNEQMQHENSNGTPTHTTLPSPRCPRSWPSHQSRKRIKTLTMLSPDFHQSP